MNIKRFANISLFGALFFTAFAFADNSGGSQFRCPKEVLTGGSYQVITAPGLPGQPVHQEGFSQIFGKWSSGKILDSFSASSRIKELPLLTKSRQFIVDRMQVAVKLQLIRFHVGSNGLLVCEYGSKSDSNQNLILKETI